MLSTSVIKNVGQASHYYSQQDNYYTREQGVEQSEWWGRGAEKLNLSGQVDAKSFTDLLSGKLPTGELLGKMVDQKIIHRPGWDLTLSAPKSVSILALIGGDTRLVDAHRQAVAVALSHVERSCGQARIQTPEGPAYQNTHNLVVARYHHDLSRAKDPQLHTHSVVMNMTERLDGKWRSLASQRGGYGEKATGEINGFIERVRHHNRYYSKVYETELAFQVKALGYAITTDTPSGVFEIAAVPREAIAFFSKRRAQIESQLLEKGLSGGKAAAVAAVDTRDAKEDVDRVALKEQWETDIRALGLDCQALLEASKENQQSQQSQNSGERGEGHARSFLVVTEEALAAIRQATQALSIFQSTFTLEEAVTAAADYAIRKHVPVSTLLAAVETQLAAGELLSLPNERGKTVLMVQATLTEEQHLFAQLESSPLVKPVIDASRLNGYLHQHQDIPVEHQAHLEILFGQARVVIIEGETARNALIEPIMKMAQSADLNVMLLSPTLVGSKQFANKTKWVPQSFWEQIKSLFIDTTPKHNSVMPFLAEMSDNTLSKQERPDVLIVENAPLLSAYQKARLVEWNKTHDTKLILLGNKATLLSQQRGLSLDQLSAHGVPTVSMQPKEPKEASMVQAVADGNFTAVMSGMAGRLVEVKDEEDRHQAMSAHYSRLSDQDRKQSWLVAHSKQTVNALNERTHQILLERGQLGKAASLTVLIPVFLPEGKGALAASYQKGQVVRFNETYSTLPINRGDYFHVIRHSKTSNRVLLQKENGEHFAWQPDKVAGGVSGKVELFNEKQREFAINETVIVNRSLRSQGIVKGERLTITAMNRREMKLQGDAGQTVVLDLSKPTHRHIDYGYSATLHAIAHEKPACLIAELPVRAFQTDQRRFYQIVSQPKEAWIYTDNPPGLAAHLEKKTGDRFTAQETYAQSQTLKQNLHSLYEILEKQLMEQKGHRDVPALSRAATEAVEYAMHHLAEREAGFTHKQLMQTAMEHALGKVTPTTLAQATLAMEQAGVVIRGERNDGTLWTTADAVKMEREIIALCQQDKGKLEPIASDALLEKYCDPAKLKPEQMAAVRAITQSRDRVMAVQGHPGTGKTTMLVTVADVLAAREVYTSAGYELLGLAPTHTAVTELTKRGISAQTLDRFMIEAKREGVDSKPSSIQWDKRILVIDEASMVSNRKMVEALQIAYQLGCRGVIPTGDTRQLASLESGKAFELVQTQVNTPQLIDIRRQSDDAPLLKQAVKETMAYDFKAAFNTLKESIIEVPAPPHDARLSKEEKEAIRYANRVERVGRLVQDYFFFAKEERDTIQIITPGHDDRVLANTLIREQLKQEGSLVAGADSSFAVLRAKSLTQVERSHLTNLAVGDVLRFGRRESAHVKAGEYFAIISMNAHHSLLTLKGEDGREVMWQVPTFDKKRLSSIEVFQRESRALQAGDVIRWSRSDKQTERLATESARVLAVNEAAVTVELANKSVLAFDPRCSSFQHWDHGYAATVYAVQGKTKDIVLAHLESFRDRLTNQPSFLVALTRAVNVFRLYTDDAKKLLKTIEGNTGVKLSSLEVIGEFPGKELKKAPKKSPPTTTLAAMADPVAKAKESRLPFDRYTIERIKEGLNQEAEQIAMDMLGNPKERGGHYLKFGSHQGSLTVTIKGEKQGWFNDFATNKGGRDMLKFIQVHGGMSHQEALQYGASRLGILPNKEGSPLKVAPIATAHQPDRMKDKSSEPFSDYERGRIQLANKIAVESQPIKGTLAEKYLKNHRGIDLSEAPKDIRFHPYVYSAKNQKGLPALIAIARNLEGKIQSVEAIYLDAKTANKADVPLPRQTIGPKKGAVVMLNQSSHSDAPTLIAEGVVTGLSLAKALPQANVRITLGKQLFANIHPDMLAQKTILCLDNDGKPLQEDKAVLEAANRLSAHKKEVSFMVPMGLDMKKQDYNDILKQKGIEAIKNDFHRAISYDDFYNNKGHLSGVNPEKMTQLSKEITRESYQKENAHLNAYRSIVNGHASLPQEKTVSIHREIERDI